MKPIYIAQTTGILLVAVLAVILPATPGTALEEHQNIKGLFNSTRDVTVKCLECHRKEAEEVLGSTHWTWERSRTVNGRTGHFGKKDSLAGFAIDIASNPSRCLGCHISTTPGNDNFSQPDVSMVDCLVCHDTTGKYNRENRQIEQQDFELIARHVGKPVPGNCTQCHFADCGLSDMSQAQSDSGSSRFPIQADIHMSAKAGSFSCQTCHINSSGHSFPRGMTHHVGASAAVQGCSTCHTDEPHPLGQLNRHAEQIACQTCHIPEFAREAPALVSWNWILAGKSSPLMQSSPNGAITVLDQNGFTQGTMIQPAYLWDDGSDQVYSRGQRIRPQELTYLQRPSERSQRSKITPFRALYGTQLYDAKYRYLVSPLLSGEGNNLFADQDWDTIAREGMKALVVPYSGQFGLAPTAMYRRINHGVVSVQDALGCLDCHGRAGRMDWDSLGYGRDPWPEMQSAGEVETSGSTSGLDADEGLPPVKETVIPSEPFF